MEPLPILKFKPWLKSVVWGGQKLGTLLDKPISSDEPFGESWELVDLKMRQSIIVGGPLDGTPLEELIQERPEDILGTAKLLSGRFPLLFKYIDAQKTLSVQVHPDGKAARRLGKGARPKTEAWYIIDCEPGAVLYVGLKPGVTKDVFRNALSNGTVESLLYQMPVIPGDYVFLAAGTVHAIGEGIVLAEVQQSSNTTYRVFDWNRVGLNGKPRPLHIDQALESINYEQVGPPTIIPPLSGRRGIKCPFFEMETVTPQTDGPAVFSGNGPIIIMGVKGEGALTIKAGNNRSALHLGETVMVPACIAKQIEISGTDPLSCMVTQIPRKNKTLQ